MTLQTLKSHGESVGSAVACFASLTLYEARQSVFMVSGLSACFLAIVGFSHASGHPYFQSDSRWFHSIRAGCLELSIAREESVRGI